MKSMVYKKHLKKEGKLEMAPMVDVVFLLLIFFVSIQFKRIAGILEARLPRHPGVVHQLDDRERLIDRHIWVRVRPVEGWRDEYARRARSGARDLQDVVVEIDHRDVRLDMDRPTDTEMTREALFDALVGALRRRKQWLQDEGKVPVVVLDLEGELTYQNVVSTVNAAKRAQFADISFTPPAGERPNERN